MKPFEAARQWDPVSALPGTLVDNITTLFPGDGLAWLQRLPEIIAQCERAWSLAALAPCRDLSYHYIAPALRADGSAVILKIGLPNPEQTTEIRALQIYAGRGCARLLDIEPELGALLLEQLRPGEPLATLADDEAATRVAAQVMRQLWRPVPPSHPFPTVARWVQGMERLRRHFEGGTGPLPRTLVERAECLFAELLDSMDEPVLLHGDLHHWNILSAQRQPWLAIDPKGVVGEPAYEAGALLRNLAPQLREQPGHRQIMARRVDVLAEELGFDRQRLLAWALAQAILSAWWSIGDHGQGWEWSVYCAGLFREIVDGGGGRPG